MTASVSRCFLTPYAAPREALVCEETPEIDQGWRPFCFMWPTLHIGKHAKVLFALILICGQMSEITYLLVVTIKVNNPGTKGFI